jgi:hypothetical protein
MEAMQMDEHKPNRPFWDCTACGEQWPCEPAQKYLRADTDSPTRLTLACWDYFDRYVHDMGPGPLGEAFQRFIGWTRG